MSGERLVVLGLTSYSPYAGVAWQTAHHLEGLRRLGWDVFYVEDHGYWPYDPYTNSVVDSCAGTVRFIGELMERFGFGDRWAYVDVASGGEVHGMSAAALAELWRTAQVIVNLTGSTELHERHLQVPVRLHLETDPVLAQIELARGEQRTLDLLGSHTHHASYGSNFGAADCGVPLGGFDYILTVPPVILEWWPALPIDNGAAYTTVGSWEQTFKDVEWEGEVYTWSKHLAFLELVDLPQQCPRRMELALAGGDAATRALLGKHGWKVREASKISADLEPYRDYIGSSWGEFTVAKDQNVRLRSGWFSDRSACYLASGRPVITQDTGFGRALPTGAGLFSFQAREDVLAAFEEIEASPVEHQSAARSLAEEHLRAETVLGALIDAVTVSAGSKGQIG